jgi:Dolichyl-phosphate-mannose-protein mannosyltransferase
MVAIPLALSAFTHVWNPVGFPAIFVDEGQYYLDRAMNTLDGNGPLGGPRPYDHPFFGQIFLGAALGLVGYPDSLNPKPGDAHFFENFWVLPRVLMGILAVIDTFLIYKIAERRYNRNVAFIAAILFAVMPLSWIIRRILLESIQLPLILSSVLFSLYAITPNTNNNNNSNNNKKIISLTLISGIFLGLAIMTKVPAITMIPLVGFLIYTNNKQYDRNKKLKHLGLWLIPVISIPLIWPAYAISVGEFDKWVDGVMWQTNRTGGESVFGALEDFYNMDPVLFMLGIVGLMYALIVKRDFFLLLFSVPLLTFLYFIGFVSYWHMIPLLAVFCIAAGTLIVDISSKVNKEKIQKILPFAIISGVAIFGFIGTAILITTTNLNSYYFQTAAYISKQISDINDVSLSDENKLTVLGPVRYFWMIPKIFDKEHHNDYINIYGKAGVETEKVLLIADRTVVNIVQNDNPKKLISDKEKQIKEIYADSKTVALIDEPNKYTYNNTYNTYDKKILGTFEIIEIYNTKPGRIEIKTNY